MQTLYLKKYLITANMVINLFSRFSDKSIVFFSKAWQVVFANKKWKNIC